MDNVSHSLAGWALARAAGPARPPGTTLALLLASNLPDLDLVLYARSPAEYLLFHRGFTHSLLGLAVLPPILAFGLWWGYAGRTPFRWFLLLAAAGVGLHLVYDVVTPWGTMLLFPFAPDRFALDWLFIVDLVTWALAGFAVLVARARPARGRAAGAAFVGALLAYGALAGALHHAARAEVARSEAAVGRAVDEAFAFPRLGAPVRWLGVAVAPADALEPRVSTWRVGGVPPAARPGERIAPGLDDPWVRRALATRAAQAYLWWARVPVAASAVGERTVVVTFRDLRYARTIAPDLEAWTPFALRVVLDRETGALVRTEW